MGGFSMERKDRCWVLGIGCLAASARSQRYTLIAQTVNVLNASPIAS